MARPRTSYLGGDQPPPPPGEPTGPEPMGAGGLVDMAGMEDAESGGVDGYEQAADLVAQAAQQYMGVNVDELDDEGWTKLLDDLRAGYPDDTELLSAIDYISGMRSRQPSEPDSAPLPPLTDSGVGGDSTLPQDAPMGLPPRGREPPSNRLRFDPDTPGRY